MGSAGVVVLCVLAVWFTKGFSFPLGATSQSHDIELSSIDSVKVLLESLESRVDHFTDIHLVLLTSIEGSGSLDTTP